MKKLPIGIQTFENLIREGYCYMDTEHLLIEASQSSWHNL